MSNQKNNDDFNQKREKEKNNDNNNEKQIQDTEDMQR